MAILNMNNIEKNYGVTEVLTDFSFYLSDGERIGLIGSNGSGKTTIFKIIAGVEPYSAGNISIRRGVNIGYLSQMPEFEPNLTLYHELKKIFKEQVEMEKKLRNLEEKIALMGSLESNDPELKKMMVEYSNLQHLFEQKDGYQYESKIKQIAMGMGFALEELQNKKTGDLSGGEKTRLGLIRLLLTEPDLLLLDEPTNHLDLPSIQWLESYLKEYQGSVIIISHDRYFLDEVVERIIEIKNGQGEVYHGNYSYYLEERKLRYEQLKREYENQQKKIKKMEESIKRLEQWGRQADNEKFFKRARSMQKSLEKIERLDRPILNGKQMSLELSISNRSGREVLKINNLAKSFAEIELLNGLNLDVYWGEKSAIIGKNGTGKTTIIKMIIGDIEPNIGVIKIGANVKIGYYSQEFEGFNPDDDLVTALRRECDMSTAEARNALAAFLFPGDDVFKKVGDLSGGEKSRLRLLQLMNGDYNFLILDEPTNHLDLPSREVLEEALSEYPGTILVISHDRFFLNKLAELIYELEEGRITKYYGDYTYYRQKKEELTQQSNKEEKNDNTVVKKSDYHRLKDEARRERKRQNRIIELEKEIDDQERLIKELEEEMVNPENLDNIELLNELKDKYDTTHLRLEELYGEWEEMF